MHANEVTIQAMRPRSTPPILAVGGDGCVAGEADPIAPRDRAGRGGHGFAQIAQKHRRNLASTRDRGKNGAGGWGGSQRLSAEPVRFDDSTISKEEQVTKSEFVDQVADRAGLTKKDAGDAVDAMLETIEGALKRGSDVVFSGFGKFSVSDRSAREGRNPATGEKIQIAASRVPKFTAGAALKKAVN
jgi:DNA-binding protein HU-beta